MMPVAAFRTRHPSATLVIAMLLLVAAGTAQETCLLAGDPGLGAWFVAPALALTAWLWRPRPVVLALVLGALGLELLLPLHTGGARLQDWLLHYQIALNYAGLPNQVQSSYLPGRTPLFHQLIAAFLSHNSGYWVFQVGAVLLNSVWLWPASLVIDRHRGGRPDLRLVAVAVAPVVIAYSTYTWPWNFSAFFLLSAYWLLDERGWVAEAGVGVALAAALLAHPASLGYVLGLGLWWLFKHRQAVLPGIAAGAVVMAAAVPWMLSVTGGRGLAGMLGGSVPALQRVPPAIWAVSRLLIVAHTVVPPLSFPTDRFWANITLAFFVLTLPGALIIVFAAGRLPRLPAAALATVTTGALLSLAIYPANQYQTGMLDGFYLGVLIYLVEAAATVDPRRLNQMLAVSAVLGAVTVGMLMLLAAYPVGGDGNAALRASFDVVFFVQRWGWAPGLISLAVALLLAIHASIHRPLPAGPA